MSTEPTEREFRLGEAIVNEQLKSLNAVTRVAELEAALADRDASIQAIVDNGLHLDATGYRNAAADALMEISRLLAGGAS